jgi:hypothetical protein
VARVELESIAKTTGQPPVEVTVHGKRASLRVNLFDAEFLAELRDSFFRQAREDVQPASAAGDRVTERADGPGEEAVVGGAVLARGGEEDGYHFVSPGSGQEGHLVVDAEIVAAEPEESAHDEIPWAERVESGAKL